MSALFSGTIFYILLSVFAILLFLIICYLIFSLKEYNPNQTQNPSRNNVAYIKYHDEKQQPPVNN